VRSPIVPGILLELLLSLAFSFFNAAAMGNELPQYTSRNWQTDAGLPHNSVYATIHGSDGYLWLGTPQGLARFDGVRCKVFNPANTPELKGISIRSLGRSRDGTLWIGTENEGLTSYKDGQFQFCSWPADKRIRATLETRDGSIWVATSGGLGRYHEGKLQWFATTNGLPNNIVLSLCEDSEGNLWIGTNNGLVRYKDGFHEVYRRGLGLNSNSVRTLLVDRDGNLWIGTNGGGLSRLRGDQFTHFNKSNGLPDDFVWTLCEDSRGQLWIGTYGGLCRRVGEKFVFESNSEGLSYEMVFCLAEDGERNIWVGTKEGLDQRTRRLFSAYTKASGLSHNNAISVREDAQGRMLIATWGGGLNILRDGQISAFNQTNGLSYDVLLSVCDAKDGSIWIGTDYDGGLFRLKNGAFSCWGREEGIVDGAIRVLHEDRQGNLWMGTSGALYLWRDRVVRRFTTADGLANSFIRALCETPDGDLWIGTQGGLSRWSGGRFSNFAASTGLPDRPVTALLQDREGTLWIGTDGGGLSRFKNGKFTLYTTRQGLFNDSILEILEDDRGDLWMSCFSGVFRVNKEQFDDFDRGGVQMISCASFGKTDGMPSVQCNGVGKPAGWKSKDGWLWFPTTRGVISVDPNSAQEKAEPPKVVIEEVIANNQRFEIQGSKFRVHNQDGGGETNSTSRFEGSPLSLPPGHGELEFHYTALSFKASEKSRFKYKLEGLDRDWVDSAGRRIAHYNNVQPGTYRFRIIGCNSEGIWNEAGDSVEFTLRPQFWQTTWFVGLTALASIGLVAGASRYLTWIKVRRQLLRLEQQHAVERERTRIAQDMHDDFGARVTEILMLSDGARKHDNLSDARHGYEEITGVAQEMVRDLDSLVWAINPRHDSLDRLSLYLCEYLMSYFARTSIRCRLDVPDELPGLPLSSEVRHNIVLVVKEAINNAVKYSAGSEVRFRLQLENAPNPVRGGLVTDSMLLIVIEDNGRGFSTGAVSGLGNGLLNMRKRMENIAGSCEISSEPGKGTRVQLRIRIRPEI
jgi:ligand-binding sensor domain-containing protein/signal transduction histidine kinase